MSQIACEYWAIPWTLLGYFALMVAAYKLGEWSATDPYFRAVVSWFFGRGKE